MSPKRYPCTFAACDKAFSKAYELRKHLATHKDPDSVFLCPECDFITLHRKNLIVHVATHTGDTPYHCPDMITVDDEDGAYEEPCGFKTNDPASLTKHRKKAHNYVPSPKRGRTVKARGLLSKRKAAKNARKSQKPPPSPSPPAASEVANTTASTSTATPDDRTLQLWRENVTAHVKSMQSDSAQSTKVGVIKSWLENTGMYKTQEDAPDASKDATRPVDPGPSVPLDPLGNRDLWAETDALMSMPLDAFTFDNTPRPRLATPLPAPNVSATPRPLDAFGNHAPDLWAETNALWRTMSVDASGHGSLPLPSWVTPLSAPAGCLDASAIHHVARPWANADALMRSAVDSLDLFGVDYTRHPWAEPVVPANNAPWPLVQSSAGMSATGHDFAPVACGSYAAWPGNLNTQVQLFGNVGGPTVYNPYFPASDLAFDMHSVPHSTAQSSSVGTWTVAGQEFTPGASANHTTWPEHDLDTSGNAGGPSVYDGYFPAGNLAPDVPVNSLYNPMPYDHWMAAFDYDCFHADPNGMHPLVVPGARMGHEACLCPDCMHEAGMHKEYIPF